MAEVDSNFALDLNPSRSNHGQALSSIKRNAKSLMMSHSLIQANASAKRVAAQNEAALRNLKIWMLVAPFIAMCIRFFFRSSVLPPSKTSILIHVLTFVPVFVLYTHLNSIGSPRRDSQTGALIGSGEDLNMHGVTEWCWDIIYVTWACQIGSAVFGEWFWSLYLCVRFAYTLFESSLTL
jgi:hypothetical protein